MTPICRVHYLASSFVPFEDASSVHVVRMTAALNRQGAEATLFCKAGMPQSIETYYGLKEPLNTITVPFGNRWGLIRYLRALHKAPRPDFVLGRYAYGSYWSARQGSPVLYEVHAPATGVKRQVEQRLFRSPRLIGLVAITQALADEYRRQYPFLADRTIVLPDAADDPVTIRSPSLTGPLTAAYAGGWFKGRGLELILAAAAALPAVRFRLAGGTRAQLTELGLNPTPNVECVGYLAPATVDDFLRQADVLLAPYASQVSASHGRALDTTRWCSPMKLFEYLSHGKAILCSDLPVLREVMLHNSNCLLLPPEEPEPWIDALQLLAQDRALARRLGATARTDFLARHTWDQRAAQVLAFARQHGLCVDGENGR